MTQLIQAGKQLLDIANSVQYTSAGKVVLDSAGAVKFLRAGKLLFDTNGFLQYIRNGKLYVGKDATLTAYSSDSTGKITTSFEDARVSDIYIPDHEGVLHAIPGGTVAFEGARVTGTYPNLEFWNIDSSGAPITTPIKMVHAPAATNEQLGSLDFSARIINFCTITADDSVAPDGTNTADKVDKTATGDGMVQTNYSITSGTISYTNSVYVKKTTADANYLGLRFSVQGGTQKFGYLVVNTNTGAISAIDSVLENGFVEDIGDYWRVGASITDNDSGNILLVCSIYPAFNTSGTTTQDTSALGYKYLWGEQMEQSSFATPIIPTSGATASRDICQIRAPYAGAFNQAEGVAYMEWEPEYVRTDVSAQTGLVTTRSSQYSTLYLGANAWLTSNDNTTYPQSYLNFTSNTRYHVAVRWKTGSTFQIGYRARGSSAWTWGTAASYDGSFTTDELFVRLFYNNPYNNNFHNLEILNKDIGTTAIEDRYSLAKVG